LSWTEADIPDLAGRVAVVTGANGGLGFEATRELARRGAAVVMGVRSLDRGGRAAERIRAAVPGASLEVRQLDLGSLESIRRFAAAVLGDHPAVDLLVNNAGVMATPPGQTADGFETQVGTNHLGHFALTAAIMPALERATAGRVVTMTSIARQQGHPMTEAAVRGWPDYDPWRAYSDSKRANYQFGLELARRLADAGSPVASLVAHPGLSHTDLQTATVRNGGTGFSGRFWAFAARWVGMTPLHGVRPALRAATDPTARSGEFYGPRWTLRGAAVRLRVDPRTVPADELERLWRLSEAATGVEFRVAGRA
jgi:NAD(P)-dependent dehydrogenase (short-subunit alcohol dehydrogenase family)